MEDIEWQRSEYMNLRKNLDIQSKDIIGYLAENGMEVKSQSGLDDAQTAMITKKVRKAGAGTGESGAREGFR